MADNNIEVKVTTTQQGDGLKQTIKETDKLGASKTELRHILNHLNREFPILGMVARAALNPLVAGTALAINALRLLNEQIKTTLALLSPSEWKGRADAIAASKKALEDAKIAAAGFKEELSQSATATDTIRTATENLINAIHRQATAEAAIKNAEMGVELALVDAGEKSERLSPEAAAAQRAGIRKKFADQEDTAKTLAENKEINTILQERVKLWDRIAVLQRELPAIQQDAAAAQADQVKIEKERDIHASNIAASNAKIAQFDTEIESRSKFGMRSGIFDKLTDKDIQAARQSEIDARDKTQGILDRSSRERVQREIENRSRIAAARRAEEELRSGTGRMSAMDEDVDRRLGDYNSGVHTRRTLGLLRNRTMDIGAFGEGAATPLGQSVLRGAGAADALAAGKGITGADAQIMIQIASLINGHKVSLEKAAAMLKTANDTINDFNTTVDSLHRGIYRPH